MNNDWPIILAFIVTVPVMLGIDLYLVGRKKEGISTKTAAIWTGVWVGVSLLFAGFIYFTMGKQPATEFVTAYLIEKALSVDNLFVFILVFNYFKVPELAKHKVLFYGIMGAIVLRAVFIFVGVELIEFTNLYTLLPRIANGINWIAGTNLDWHSEWLRVHEVNIVLVLFGAFLMYAGVKTGITAFKGEDEEEEDYSNSAGARIVRKLFKGKVTDEYDEDKFFIRRKVTDYVGIPATPVQKIVKYATPLLIVVAVIEITDLLFAVDSIPAIFSVSKDPFILFTSNIFAILGLRTMYFLLDNVMKYLRFLPHGLAVILAFIGFKMLSAVVFHIDSTVSLIIVGGILAIATIISYFYPEKEEVKE